MTEHLFLTGEIQVGKSTLLRRFLTEKKQRIAGFRTVWSDGERRTLHLLPCDGGVCCEENCVAERLSGKLVPRPEIFDRLGPVLLGQPCDLLVMDELGFLESTAPAFRSAVLAALDGSIPVVGVIQPRHTEFLDAVRAHEGVHIVTVTVENRDTLSLFQSWNDLHESLFSPVSAKKRYLFR